MAAVHPVLGTPEDLEVTPGLEAAVFGLGCFWGAERKFWECPGVRATAVGYAGGAHARPSYELVCSGRTGHAEVVRVVYSPKFISFLTLVTLFFEAHDPTQGNRQGNDVGTQYRSVIFTTTPEQLKTALATKALYEATLQENGFGAITTEIGPLTEFWFAEGYHQAYLHKNPTGYCGLRGTGVACIV